MTGSSLTRFLSFTECPRPSSKSSGNSPTIPILVFSGLIILAQLVVMIVLVHSIVIIIAGHTDLVLVAFNYEIDTQFFNKQCKEIQYKTNIKRN